MIVDALLSSIRSLSSTPSGTKNPRQWLIDWTWGGPATEAGVHVSAETALTCAAVKSCVALLSETVAGLPCHVYERLPNGDKRHAADHPLDLVLNRTGNDETSAFNLRETLMGHVLLWGNAFAEIDLALAGNARALWQRDPRPSRTKPVRGDDGRIYYECRDENGTVELTAEPRHIFHLAGLGFDGLVGYSPITHGRQSIGTLVGAEKYAAQFFGRDCRPAGIVTVPDYLKPEAYERTKASFNQNDERHRIQLLEGGATFAATQMDPGQVQLVEARRLGVEDIARIFRVPLPLLQHYQSGMAYASVVELDRAFVVHTIAPWCKRWEAEINRKLLSPPFFAEHVLQAFLQGDHGGRAEMYRVLWNIGAMSTNDILRKENMNGIGPEGDRRFVPLNTVPLDRVDDLIDAKIAKATAPSGSASGSSGNPALRPQLRRLLADVLTRHLTRDGKAAMSAAKKPQHFLSWMDGYFRRGSQFLAQEVAPVIEGFLALGDRVFGHTAMEPAVLALVERVVDDSRQALLQAAECQPRDLAARVAACVESWPETRAYPDLEGPDHA